MELLIIQRPILTLIIWTLLNLAQYCLNILNSRLYKNLVDGDFRYVKNYKKTALLRHILWIGFGILILSAYRQAFLQEAVTAYECSVWYGAFFFLVIGHLIGVVLYLGKYFVYHKENLRTTCSFSASMILQSCDLFGYSILVLLSFLITTSPFLLGGAIGLAFGGSLPLFELINKKCNFKINTFMKKKEKN